MVDIDWPETRRMLADGLTGRVEDRVDSCPEVGFVAAVTYVVRMGFEIAEVVS